MKTGSGGKNDGGRPVSAPGRGGGGGRSSGTWSSGSSSSGYSDRNAGRGGRGKIEVWKLQVHLLMNSSHKVGEYRNTYTH